MTVSRATIDVDLFELHRRELTGYCYRMLGSAAEAEDAVQDTMLRAWRAADSFEGRSSVRSWLYRIATNVCLDLLRGQKRRARPMELGPARPPDPVYLDAVGPENLWVTPIADDRVLPVNADPASVAEERNSIRLAFVTALQHLPARQRAVLILCEVLKWKASETAELLGTSTAAVNSSLQRARAKLDTVRHEPVRPVDDAAQVALLEAYVSAFERYDISALVTLLRDDAIQSMPPYEMWLRGARDIGAWMLGAGIGCEGSLVVPTAANGGPAFGQYRVDPTGGHSPWALQVLEIEGDQIVELHFFLDTEHLFPLFGLPAHLPG